MKLHRIGAGSLITLDAMPRQLRIEIMETAERLEQQLKTARTASQKERLQMLWWLKTGQVTSHQQLAEQLGRDPSTITRWLQRYRQGGLSGLLSIKTAPGQTRQITAEAMAGLEAKLNSTEGFSSYGEIVDYFQRALQTRVDLRHCLLLGAL